MGEFRIDSLDIRWMERFQELIAANPAPLTSEAQGRLRILEEARDLWGLIRQAEAEVFCRGARIFINRSFSEATSKVPEGGAPEVKPPLFPRFKIYPDGYDEPTP
ncbi:MAG: hypothetical protein K7J47_25120 [Acidobacteria bacterium]|nr:hypothetical protein [Bryobacteraceae bacterium CoA2 C42]